MRCSLAAIPEYHLDIPIDLAQAIVLASISHYDHKCLGATIVGGFLWPLRSHQAYEGVHHIAISDEDVQTLMKICENRGALSKMDQPLLQDLLATLVQAYAYANQNIRTISLDVPLPEWAKPFDDKN
jgi:hypothetical protein